MLPCFLSLNTFYVPLSKFIDLSERFICKKLLITSLTIQIYLNLSSRISHQVHSHTAARQKWAS